MGSSVGSKLFLSHGWRASGGLTLGLTGWALVLLLARGPHCDRYTWLGYEGGIEWRKSAVEGDASSIEKGEGTDQVVAVEGTSNDEKPASPNRSLNV
jgi:hypothetical protein